IVQAITSERLTHTAQPFHRPGTAPLAAAGLRRRRRTSPASCGPASYAWRSVSPVLYTLGVPVLVVTRIGREQRRMPYPDSPEYSRAKPSIRPTRVDDRPPAPPKAPRAGASVKPAGAEDGFRETPVPVRAAYGPRHAARETPPSA